MNQASKHRACPVLQRDLTAAECGSTRHSRIQCTADCAFNPWNPRADAMAETIIAALYGKLMQRTASDPVDLARRRADLSKIDPKADPLTADSRLRWWSFHQRDSNGLTLAERWEKSGFEGLRNDHQLLIRCMMNARLALIEVRRILDATRVEVIDLLATQPEPFVLNDSTLTSRPGRYQVFLTWVETLPHNMRTAGFLINVPADDNLDPVRFTREIIRHLGGPSDGDDPRLWLADNFHRFDAAKNAVLAERSRRLDELTDSRMAVRIYHTSLAPAAFASMVEGLPGVTRADHRLAPVRRRANREGLWAWELPNDVEPGGTPLSGQIVLLGDICQLSVVGRDNLPVFQRILESLLGDAIVLNSEKEYYVSDLEENAVETDPALAPPGLVEPSLTRLLETDPLVLQPDGKQPLAECTAGHRQWLDTPNALFDEHTPRAAAQNPQLRPKLVRVVKFRISEWDFLQPAVPPGALDWIIDELGLTELNPASPVSSAATAPGTPHPFPA